MKANPLKINVAPVADADTALVTTPAVTTPIGFSLPADKIPSNWRIASTGEDTIEAVNNETRTKFSGTVAEFNRMLKG